MYNAQLTISRIQSIIKKRGLTQKEVLSRCDINENTLKRMTDNKGMSSFYLAKIADYLNCSVDYLLGRTDNPNVTADTYINGDNNNNGTQAINGSVSVTASSDSGRKDTLTEQFIQKFEQLDFDEKVDVMQYVKDIKKSPSEGGN